MGRVYTLNYCDGSVDDIKEHGLKIANYIDDQYTYVNSPDILVKYGVYRDSVDNYWYVSKVSAQVVVCGINGDRITFTDRFTLSVNSEMNNNYAYRYSNNLGNYVLVDKFANLQELKNAILSSLDPKYPITYHFTNCTAPSAPTEAVVGNIVNVPLVMQEGYGIIAPSTDILVTNNGVAVPYTFSDNTITFTMPDPS